ncbi:hypothetical protein ACFX1T_011559 [Malus domestica]
MTPFWTIPTRRRLCPTPHRPPHQVDSLRRPEGEDDDLHCSEKKKRLLNPTHPPFRSLPDSTQVVDLDDRVNSVHESEDPIPVMDLQSLKLREA